MRKGGIPGYRVLFLKIIRFVLKVNRNFIVNFNAISDVVAYSPKRLKIILQAWEGKEDILVSRERVAAFKKWMDR